MARVNDNGLTDKQERFVLALIEGKSQREAYKAVYSSKMSDDAIDRKASALFCKDVVKGRYEELKAKVIQKAEDEAIVTATEVLRELKHIAFDDISNYLSFHTEKIKIGVNDKGEDVYDYKPIVKFKDSDTIDTRNIQEVSVGANGAFKIKQYCKDNALVQLGKYLGIFTDKLNIEGAIPIVICGEDNLEE